MRFLQRVHRITHRVPCSLRRLETARVLVVAPHCDDEAIALGGSLALHRRLSSEATTAFVTLERPDEDGVVLRQREAEKAAEVLGYRCLFLNVPDGNASLHERRIAQSLAEIVCATKPDVVFTPFPGDHHRDHQAVAASTARALNETAFRGQIWCYETWSNLWPNTGVDISEVVHEKRAAIECYKSQLGLPYVDAALGLNRFRGLRFGVDYAEGFFVCELARFRRLSRTLSSL
jgi:LmbE family N-acetylglucosaminyl deacetylase